MAELGRSGLVRFGGTLYEEFLTQLRGDKAIAVYGEMMANSPVISALLTLIRTLSRQVDWRVEGENEEQAEFIDGCLHDMSATWEDTLSDILSMIGYGWSLHEIVYKRRQGYQTGSLPSSRFTDGKIGWRKIEIRAQSTRYEWIFDDRNGLQGMIQRAAPDYADTTLPIEKCLLFRPETYKNSPEGRSILRGAYRPWYLSKRIEELEAIGIERNLAGLPVLEVPAAMLDPNASSEMQQAVASYKRLITNLRRGEQEGILLPQEYDSNGNPQYKVYLLGSNPGSGGSGGTSRVMDTNVVLQRYYVQILNVALAAFIQLGHEKVGTQALSENASHVFATALNSWLDAICGVMNRYAIPRLMVLNGMPVEDPPTLVHGEVLPPDLATLGDFLQKAAGAGMTLFPDLELENTIRRSAALPELTEDAYDERTAMEQEQQAAEMNATLGLKPDGTLPPQPTPAPRPTAKREPPPVNVTANVHVPPVQVPPIEIPPVNVAVTAPVDLAPVTAELAKHETAWSRALDRVTDGLEKLAAKVPPAVRKHVRFRKDKDGKITGADVTETP